MVCKMCGQNVQKNKGGTKAALKLIPMVPSDTNFFTRRSGRLGTLRPPAAFPWQARRQGGMTFSGPTQVPFYEMWVKIRASRAPQDAYLLYESIIAEDVPVVKGGIEEGRIFL